MWLGHAFIYPFNNAIFTQFSTIKYCNYLPGLIKSTERIVGKIIKVGLWSSSRFPQLDIFIFTSCSLLGLDQSSSQHDEDVFAEIRDISGPLKVKPPESHGLV